MRLPTHSGHPPGGYESGAGLVPLDNQVEILIDIKSGMEADDGGAFSLLNDAWSLKGRAGRQAVSIINRGLYEFTGVGEVGFPLAFDPRSFSP